MKMHILSGGRLRMRKVIYYPDAAPEETLELPVSSILLRHSKGNVLFDTGCHPDIGKDPTPRWGGLARFMTPVMAEDDHLLNSLACIGLSPDDISHVVCSHLHTDHCGCNQFFTKAKIFIHEAELAAARAPDGVRMGYLPADWDHPIPVELVREGHDLFGDGRIRLLHLPGHTPGAMGALVRLDRDGLFLLASDAASVKANLDDDFAPKNTWDVEKCLESYARIREIAQAGATVIYGHDDAQWRALRRGSDCYA
ncbi:N-acyl homoserine lactonase family protein [Camelimonas sp. ID_303_24]